LIAENYTIPDNVEVSIQGDGLLLIQDGASFYINGKLNVSGDNNDVILKSESNNGIMLFGGELNLKNVTGNETSIFASGAMLNIEDCAFMDTSNPLIVKSGSSLWLHNVSIYSAGTAGYISDANVFDARNIEIRNSSKGFIILNPKKVYISEYKAKEGIKNTGLEIKNSDSEDILLEELKISSRRFALNLENLKSVFLNGAKLKSSSFYVIALSNVEDAQITNVSVSNIPEKGKPNIGFFIASTGGIFKNISVSECKETGIFVNNRLLPEALMDVYKPLSPKEKENWAPLILYADATAFSNNFYDIYIEGIYNLYAPGLDLSQLRIYDYRVDKTWSNELGRIFPRGNVIIDSIEISKLSAVRDGDSVKLSWKSDLKSYVETDVSYHIIVDDSTFKTTEKSYILPLPEETTQIKVIPLYKGVPFGPEKSIEVMGKPHKVN